QESRCSPICDGENDRIGHVFGDCGVDVVESVCPSPMTSLDQHGLRTAFGPNVSDNVPPDADLSRLEYLGTRFTEVASG
ncbi:MAG TPA: hypothetical protein DGN59_06780, partial [Candidatus Latescibacteria bacterium]|nr:hypothetical protein [Candidatus Latescibacterota bacterium]